MLLALILIWEGAYRLNAFDENNPKAGGWRPWSFPAPSHILDSTLYMLNVRTGFGEPLSANWPGPRSAAERDVKSWYESPLITAQVVSITRVIAGFGLSILLGGVLGAAMWRTKWLDELLGPVFLGMQTLPSVCWVPLAILLFGINEQGIMFVLIMGSFFAIAIALRDGLRAMPPIYQRAGLMLGARGWKLYRYVLLPASLPALAGSLRQGFSFAWRSLMGAELIMLVQNRGLGFLLSIGRDFQDIAQVVAVMIVMVVVGMLVDRWGFAKLQQAVNARFGLG